MRPPTIDDASHSALPCQKSFQAALASFFGDIKVPCDGHSICSKEEITTEALHANRSPLKEQTSNTASILRIIWPHHTLRIAITRSPSNQSSGP